MSKTANSPLITAEFNNDFVAMPNRDPQFVGLLGRDFLQNVVLTLDGPRGTYTIASPHSVPKPPVPGSISRAARQKARQKKKKKKGKR